MVGSVLQGLIVLNNLDTYIYQSWHGTLLTIAVIVFASLFNTLLAVRLPMIEGVLLILHLAGLFAIIIPLWVMAPRGNVKDTILTFTTTAGWSDVSLASLIGMVSVIAVLVGYDCTVHMCEYTLMKFHYGISLTSITAEEVQDASIVLPQVLMWSISVNGIMAIVMGVTFIFCIGDIDSVLASPTNEPFIQVFYNATQSYAGATIMTMIIVVMLTSACISEVATASRQLWSFARDNGLPCSKWLSHVPDNWNIPLNAVLVSVVISTLLSMINIGSYVALNAINSLGVVSLLFSYTVTIRYGGSVATKNSMC
jgi:choline transport protein